MKRRSVFGALAAAAALAPIAATAKTINVLSPEQVAEKLYGLHDSVRNVSFDPMDEFEAEYGRWYIFRIIEADSLDEFDSKVHRLASYAAFMPHGKGWLVTEDELKADAQVGYSHYMHSVNERRNSALESQKLRALIARGIGYREIPQQSNIDRNVYGHGFFRGYEKLNRSERVGMSI